MTLYELIERFKKIPGIYIEIDKFPKKSLIIYDLTANPNPTDLANPHTLYVISDNSSEPLPASVLFHAATFREGHPLCLKYAENLIRLSADEPQEALSVFTQTFHALQKLESDLILMYQGLVNNLGLQKLVNNASARLKNPLFLLDQTLRQLTKIPRVFPVMNATMQEEIYIGHLLPETINQIRMSRTLDAIHNSSIPYIWQIPQGITFAAYPVRYGSIIIAYMILIQSGTPFAPEDMDFLQRIEKIISCEMMKEGNLLQNKGSRYAAIVEDLITDKGHNQDIPDFLSSLGYQLREVCTVLVVPIFSDNVTDGHVFLQLGEQIKHVLAHGLYLIKERNLIFLFDSDQSLTDFQIDGLNTLLSPNHLVCGVSSSKRGLSAVRKQYEEALEALRFGKNLFPEKNICLYADCQAFHAVSLVKDVITLDSLAGGLVSKLIEYDRRNETTLLTTLGVYLMQGQSVPRTATTLFIHENTLRYRIKKISELAGCDIHRGNIVFEIMLCLYSMRLSENTASQVSVIFDTEPEIVSFRTK